MLYEGDLLGWSVFLMVSLLYFARRSAAADLLGTTAEKCSNASITQIPDLRSR